MLPSQPTRLEPSDVIPTTYRIIDHQSEEAHRIGAGVAVQLRHDALQVRLHGKHAQAQRFGARVVAVAEGGSVYLNRGFMRRLGLEEEDLAGTAEREAREVTRRALLFRMGPASAVASTRRR